MTVIKREESMEMPSITICATGNISELLLHCNFGYKEIPCNNKNLVQYINGKNKINCIRLSVNETNQIQLGDRWYDGYKVIFYVPSGDQLIFGVTDKDTLAVEQDLAEPINYGIYSIALTKIKQIILDEPYSNCKMTVGYRQANCVTGCFFEYMTKLCGCNFPEDCPVEERSDICINSTSQLTLIESECKRSKCPSECEQDTYHKKTIQYTKNFIYNQKDIDFMMDAVSKKIRIPNITEEETFERIVDVTFYYEKLETTVVTQLPSMTLLDLVASIGGILGNQRKIISF